MNHVIQNFNKALYKYFVENNKAEDIQKKSKIISELLNTWVRIMTSIHSFKEKDERKLKYQLENFRKNFIEVKSDLKVVFGENSEYFYL